MTGAWRDGSGDWLGALYERFAASLFRYAAMILADRAAAAAAIIFYTLTASVQRQLIEPYAEEEGVRETAIAELTADLGGDDAARRAPRDVGYVAYSVGSNRQDDGGDVEARWITPKELSAMDLGIRIRYVN